MSNTAKSSKRTSKQAVQSADLSTVEVGPTFKQSDSKPLPSFEDLDLMPAAQTRNQYKPKADYETTSPMDILSGLKPNQIEQASNEILSTGMDEVNAAIEEEKKSYKLHINLKKIQRFGFRLGMERQEGQPQLVPGTGQTFVPFKKGKHFITGLESRPEDRKRLENILGVDLSTTSTFFEDLTFRMEDRPGGQIIMIDNSFNGALLEVTYHCMIASPLVANGLNEYTSGVKDTAEWYIENKEAEAEANQKIIGSELEAFELFNNMSDNRRVQLSKILGMKVWGLSPSVVKIELWGWLKKVDPANPMINNIAKFLKEAKNNDTVIAVKALIEDAIFYNVFRLNNARDYVYGDEPLGATKEAVLDKLTSPRNAALRAGIEERVNLKS